jgi:hypothetical protein
MYLPVPKTILRCTGVAVLVDDLLQALNFGVCCLNARRRGHSSSKRASCKMGREYSVRPRPMWSPFLALASISLFLLLFLGRLGSDRGTGER